MKKILLITFLYFFVLATSGQVMSVSDLFSLASYPASKCDNYLSRNGFAFTGKEVRGDTLVRKYDYRRTRNFRDNDSIPRGVSTAQSKDFAAINFETTSLQEFQQLKAQLKKEGFYCNNEAAETDSTFLLYQHKDLSVQTGIRKIDTIYTYSLLLQKKKFPKAKDIYYADDLLTFTSHEYLVHYFGEKNVKKDIYFLSGNEIAKCSVLFLNTNRQVVFIWGDEENRCQISSLLFGGQQNLQSSMESGKYVEENNWALKSGVRPGMSLLELRMLNGNDFTFYGGNSANSGSVLPDNAGKLNFKKEEVILGCLNCRDDKYSMAKVVHADDSIEEGRILFVLSVILNPL